MKGLDVNFSPKSLEVVVIFLYFLWLLLSLFCT